MKKLLLLLTIFLFTQSSITQTMRIRTTSYSYSDAISDYKYNEWSKWKPVNLLILVNTDDMIIMIDNDFRDKFYLRSMTQQNGLKDHDGDLFNCMDYICYDNKDIECFIKVYSWNDYNLYHIYVYYSNIRYVYEGKMIY